jgi:RND family efflux transporter MFP subunit
MNKVKFLALAIIAGAIMVSCGGKKYTEDLAGKREELDALKKESQTAQARIAKLESEIAKLDPAAASQGKAKRIGIDTVATSDFKHYIEIQGSVDALENNLALQQIPGMVTAIYVREGDRVSKGQVLFVTDASTYEKQMEVVESQYDLAKTAFEKQKKLWDQNIGSELQYLQAKTGKETLEKQMGNLRAALEMTKCKSPINGTVDEVRVKLGDMAAPSQLMPGIRVVNFSNLVVKAKLSDSQIGKVKEGDKVKVSFPDINKTIDATVSHVGQTVDKQTRTFNVEVRLSNPSSEYKANMITKLMINDDTEKAVVVIPENVVQRSEMGEYVLVAENGRAVKKTVKTGMSYDGKIVVTEGLTVGDKLITFGYTEVVDGQKVEF